MNKSIGLALALFPACGLMLSACGGGGDDDTGLAVRAADVNGSSAIARTGGSPPNVTSAQAESELLDINYGANIGHRSTTIEVDYDGNVQRTSGGKRIVECDPPACNFGDTVFTPIMTKNGVSLAKAIERESSGDGGVDTTLSYGGWMDHSAFLVRVITETYDAGTFVNWVTGYSQAIGDAPETNPSTGTFSWSGVMVGRNSDILSTQVSNVVQGDAAISGELSNMGDLSVDVEFSNIVDLNSGSSINDMTWSDLSVVDGSFDGGSIEGSFFGPQHEEVAGVFHRNNILGAFGASR